MPFYSLCRCFEIQVISNLGGNINASVIVGQTPPDREFFDQVELHVQVEDKNTKTGATTDESKLIVIDWIGDEII